MAERWLRVPIGPKAARWVTGGPERVVLAVVHNVTSLTRLLDVVTAFDSDPPAGPTVARPGRKEWR